MVKKSEIEAKLREARESRETITDMVIGSEDDMGEVVDMTVTEYFNVVSWLEVNTKKVFESSGHEKLKKEVENEFVYSEELHKHHTKLREGKMNFPSFQNELKMLNAGIRDGTLGTGVKANLANEPETMKPSDGIAKDFAKGKPEEIRANTGTKLPVFQEDPEDLDEINRLIAEQQRLEEQNEKQMMSNGGDSRDRDQERRDQERRDQERRDQERRDQERRDQEKRDKQQRDQREKEKQEQLDRDRRKREAMEQEKREQEKKEREARQRPTEELLKADQGKRGIAKQSSVDEEYERARKRRQDEKASREKLMREIVEVSKEGPETAQLRHLGRQLADITQDDKAIKELKDVNSQNQRLLSEIKMQIMGESDKENHLTSKRAGLRNITQVIKSDIDQLMKKNANKTNDKNAAQKEVDSLEKDLKELEREIEAEKERAQHDGGEGLALRKQRQIQKEVLQRYEIEIKKYKQGYESLLKKWNDEISGQDSANTGGLRGYRQRDTSPKGRDLSPGFKRDTGYIRPESSVFSYQPGEYRDSTSTLVRGVRDYVTPSSYLPQSYQQPVTPSFISASPVTITSALPRHTEDRFSASIRSSGDTPRRYDSIGSFNIQPLQSYQPLQATYQPPPIQEYSYTAAVGNGATGESKYASRFLNTDFRKRS